ncbi:hypothetical protein DITRI_Ditri07aG0011600 [Diplodiscus trichospermus]
MKYGANKRLYSFSNKYSRTYRNKAEKERRFRIFKQIFEYVRNFNNGGNKTYKLSINEYSDWTPDEFVAARTGYINPGNIAATSPQKPFTYAEFTEVPTSLDWREKGAVTSIKDQGKYCAVAAMEGIVQIKTGQRVPLSGQQVLDCSTNDHACIGGSKTDAFQYIIQNRGLTTEDNYPYQATQGTCDKVKEKSQAAYISNYVLVPPNNEDELLKAVSNQPVAMSIDARALDFRHYKSGIYNGDCGTNLNHAVTIVGFGTSEDGMDYWLVKNSWGQRDWGENGYIRMRRNVGGPQGLCVIAIKPAYPIV